MFSKRCYDMPKQNKMPNPGRDNFQNIEIEQNINEVSETNNSYYNDPSQYMNMNMMNDCCPKQPIIEKPIVKCVHRTFCHNVPHVCPIKTKIINHHIYKHTYKPCYSCEEQNDVCQIDEGSCCKFR